MLLFQDLTITKQNMRIKMLESRGLSKPDELIMYKSSCLTFSLSTSSVIDLLVLATKFRSKESVPIGTPIPMKPSGLRQSSRCVYYESRKRELEIPVLFQNLLLIDKARVKDKTYKWMSVRWKTKNERWGFYTSRIHWVVRVCCSHLGESWLLWIEKTRPKDKTYEVHKLFIMNQ